MLTAQEDKDKLFLESLNHRDKENEELRNQITSMEEDAKLQNKKMQEIENLLLDAKKRIGVLTVEKHNLNQEIKRKELSLDQEIKRKELSNKKIKENENFDENFDDEMYLSKPDRKRINRILRDYDKEESQFSGSNLKNPKNKQKFLKQIILNQDSQNSLLNKKYSQLEKELTQAKTRMSNLAKMVEDFKNKNNETDKKNYKILKKDFEQKILPLIKNNKNFDFYKEKKNQFFNFLFNNIKEINEKNQDLIFENKKLNADNNLQKDKILDLNKKMNLLENLNKEYKENIEYKENNANEGFVRRIGYQIRKKDDKIDINIEIREIIEKLRIMIQDDDTCDENKENQVNSEIRNLLANFKENAKNVRERLIEVLKEADSLDFFHWMNSKGETSQEEAITPYKGNNKISRPFTTSKKPGAQQDRNNTPNDQRKGKSVTSRSPTPTVCL